MNSNFLIYSLVIFTLVIRLQFLSPFLEDWDSVQFALGLHNYSITEHQPHPPGYPLYILFGKFFYFFLNDDLKALSFLSALFGSLLLVNLYFLTKKMFDQLTALIATVIFISTPLPWLLSEVALTDIPGLFFLTLAAYLIYITRNNQRIFLLICLLSGLILGFRTNSFLIIVGLIFLVVLKRNNLKFTILSIILLIAGTAIWLLPLIIITGPKQFLNSYFSISNYVISHDIFLGDNLSFKNIIKLKAIKFWYLSQIAYTPLLSSISIITLIYLFFKRKFWSEFKYQFLSVWITAHLIPQFVFYNLEMPRHTLALLPPILILISSVLSDLIAKNKHYVLFLLLILSVLFTQSWSQIQRFKSQVPPTIQPIQYIKNNFKPEDVIIISSLTYRHLQYYAPEYKTYYSRKDHQIDIPKGKTVIIDHPDLKDKIIQSANFKITDSYEFKGDNDIYPRVSKTNLYILKRQDEK